VGRDEWFQDESAHGALQITEGASQYDKTSSLPEKLLSTASWRGPATTDANGQMADFKRHFSSCMAIKMHNAALRLLWNNLNLFN
jgi:hypothetical protein